MSGKERVRSRLLIHGRVQGVWYRRHAAIEAERSGLGGWVRNLASGAVEAEVEGPAEAVDAFLNWCRKGPPLAVVDHVETKPMPCIGEATFRVRYDA